MFRFLFLYHYRRQHRFWGWTKASRCVFPDPVAVVLRGFVSALRQHPSLLASLISLKFDSQLLLPSFC
uniref:Uncharacterized protein n=1 Tax=Anopheles funestus TaxID=62324 RepID=A0A182S1R9_ANOFN